MADPVEVAFHRAARSLLAPDRPLIVAVSGGGDSVALLHLLTRLAQRRRPRLIVAHLDHALRRGSGADRRFVVRLAAALGLPCVSDRCDVAAARRKDESLEEAARRLRRTFLATAAKEASAETIATGHTLDDQAETIVMRLARGAGPSTWTAMAPAGPGPFVKPVLSIEREALRAWLGKRRLPFREDPSNRNLAFDRNRVRRLIVPALARDLNPAAARHLVEVANRVREDASFLDAVARERFDALALRRAGRLELQAEALAALPRPLATRVARIALEEAGCDARRVSSRHVEAVLALASSVRGASIDLPGRRTARRRGALVEFRACDSPETS